METTLTPKDEETLKRIIESVESMTLRIIKMSNTLDRLETEQQCITA